MLHSRGLGVFPVIRAHCSLICQRCIQRTALHRTFVAAKGVRSVQILASSTADVDVQPSTSAAGTTELQPRSQMSWEGRDRGCGTLTEKDVGSSFTLCGWVHRQRNLGGVGRSYTVAAVHQTTHRPQMLKLGFLPAGVCFVDIRDSTGIVQVRLSVHGITVSPSFPYDNMTIQAHCGGFHHVKQQRSLL